MKLNAAAAMEPITDPAFADIHPFAPRRVLRAISNSFHRLESWLASVTGYAAVSIQPNAGSQGEFAGLMAIRAFHRASGDSARTVPHTRERPWHECCKCCDGGHASRRGGL